MTRQARFEIIRTNAGWHARFVARNGRTVWTTEVYEKRGGVIKAINILAGATQPTAPFIRKEHGRGVRDVGYGVEVTWLNSDDLLEVRILDERDS